MEIFKKAVKILFIISLGAFIGFCFLRPPLPPKEKVSKEVANIEPFQGPSRMLNMEMEKNGFSYEIIPLAEYELYGLVVSQYSSESVWDLFHKDDPGNSKDICLVWGDNISGGAYRKVRYHSGEFTCFYRWFGEIDPPFSDEQMSNNHLIPKDRAIEEKIKNVAIGDQIRIKGQLVDYKVKKEGKEVGGRTSSLDREDTGNGACEVIYVEDIEILKRGSKLFLYGKDISLSILIVSLAVMAILFIREAESLRYNNKKYESRRYNPANKKNVRPRLR